MMVVKARRRALMAAAALLAVVGAGGTYETLRGSTATATALVNGRGLVDVGGHRLAIRCAGSGSPTVVLEPGLGESATEMRRWIGPGVARTTRICVYDRAGHGRSEAAPGHRADGARDLHNLLERSGIPGPYVLAGHSLGGIFALSSAHRYPDEVAGVVLLDSMHPKQTAASTPADPLMSLVPMLSHTGLAGLLFDKKDGDPGTQMRRFARDVTEMPAELNRAARLTSLGKRPLAVITAGGGNAPGWSADQNRLATLSTDSTHRVVAGSTHMSLIDDRVHARQSIDAVHDVVRAIRRSEPLG